jgi:hypothetical protein
LSILEKKKINVICIEQRVFGDDIYSPEEVRDLYLFLLQKTLINVHFNKNNLNDYLRTPTKEYESLIIPEKIVRDHKDLVFFITQIDSLFDFLNECENFLSKSS